VIVNNSTNISKTNNHLQFLTHWAQSDHNMWRWNRGLGTDTKCAGLTG